MFHGLLFQLFNTVILDRYFDQASSTSEKMPLRNLLYYIDVGPDSML